MKTQLPPDRTERATSNPILFLLEDDACTGRKYAQIAKEEGWHVIHVRHLQEAFEHAASIRKITLFVIDLMLPGNLLDLEEVEKLLQKKAKIRRRNMNGANSTNLDVQQLSRSFVQLDQIEHSIRERLKFDGGIEFLKEAIQLNWMAEATVVVFSARLPADANLAGKLDELKRAIPDLILMPKPVTAQSVRELLRKVACVEVQN